jgi:hypothetical protein
MTNGDAIALLAIDVAGRTETDGATNCHERVQQVERHPITASARAGSVGGMVKFAGDGLQCAPTRIHAVAAIVRASSTACTHSAGRSCGGLCPAPLKTRCRCSPVNFDA